MPSRSVIFAGFFGFLLIGALQAFYGPAQFSLRETFGVSPQGVGAYSSSLFAGSVVSILALPFLEQRFSLKPLLLVSSGLLILGALAVTVVGTWWLALLAMFVVGLGFGVLDLGFNVLFSTAFGTQSAAYANILNAMFGVGSVLGPLLVGLFPGNFRVPYLIAAGVAVIVLLVVARSKLPATTNTNAPPKLRVSSTLVLFVVMFFVYVFCEVGTAGAEPRHLHDALDYSKQSAAFINSLFWGGLAVGRLLVAPLALRLPASNIVLGSSLLLLILLALTHVASIAPVMYTLAGVVCGPIFPTGLVWLSRVIPGSTAAASIVIAAASFGGVVAPFGINLIAPNAAQIPTALTVYALLLSGLALTLWWRTQRGGEHRA
jgi:MFS transporter, FHS family, glucose/mannose:H+ symporter